MKIANAALMVLLLAPSANLYAQLTCEIQTFDFVPPKIADGTIEVRSNAAQIIKDEIAVFEGNVTITTAESIIKANSANVRENGQRIQASGDVTYTDELLKVESLGIEANADIELLQLQSSEYQIKGINGRGGADLLSISRERGVMLEDVSFTTCPKGGEDWKIQASEISIKKGRPFGEAKHTRFYVGGVPVFYLPYFAFPITTGRQTGFLFPKIGSSSSTGIEYEQPFYWNIAPNLDTTIATRYMTNRGLQLKNEWRYLSEQHQGELQLEYLANDTDTESGDARYFYRFKHKGKLSDNWSITADISDISDNNYIVDLRSDYYNQADTHLYRQAGLSYFTENLDFSMFVRDFTIIGNFNDNYRALPEAKLSYSSDINSWLDFDLRSELAYFDNRLDNRPDALRVHVEPSLSIPYQRAWGELLAEVSILHTYYDQDLEGVGSTVLEETVERTLGQARLYGSLIFEREQKVGNDNYLVTFEPKAQYLYTSFQEQFNIGRYDTTALLTTFSNLFRGQEFTGLDRINDNNQFTVGATARIIDNNNREVLSASIGQILYLEDAKLQASQRLDNRSAIAAEFDWRVNRNWFLHTDVQVGTDTNKVERSSFSTEYRLAENKLIQVNHRYIRELSNEKIDQFGISASWPINDNWHWVGRYYRDFERSRTTESFMGIEYESCCWALRLTVQRHLATRFNNDGVRDIDDFDSGIALQFVFKGMGSQTNKVDMLRQGLFGYRQPFVLN
ncbi:LPS-assembly protein LptD [Glaciecola siphonariae]|uniref:LPS-assembly protein LptD n=1 Tax=Glaciecola siphonariae TaxID=521012 RepID=A0ABV9LZJ3_9ALTE